MKKLIIPIGVPGSGKGTQARLLAKKSDVVHISTGNLFRQNIKDHTELGKQAQQYHDSGDLVPDELTQNMVEERLSQEDCENKVILDGYPRTMEQVASFEHIAKKLGFEIYKIIYIHLDESVMRERLQGRWSCKAYDHTYHEVFSPPKVKGICDFDGSELYQRADQTTEAINERIEKYNESTAKVVEHYRKHPGFIEIDGNQTIAKVHEDVIKKLAIAN